MLESKELPFFFQIQVPRCWWEVKPEFINSLKFQKDTCIPNERNALNRTDNSPCQKQATKIQHFNQLLKSKIQPLTAHADRLTFLPKLMQFRLGVYYTLRSARKAAPDLCMHTHIVTYMCKKFSDICCTDMTNDIFSHDTIPPKYLFTDFCTVF